MGIDGRAVSPRCPFLRWTTKLIKQLKTSIIYLLSGCEARVWTHRRVEMVEWGPTSERERENQLNKVTAYGKHRSRTINSELLSKKRQSRGGKRKRNIFYTFTTMSMMWIACSFMLFSIHCTVQLFSSMTLPIGPLFPTAQRSVDSKSISHSAAVDSHRF